MKLKFKHQQFQIDAAKAVTDVFQGQQNSGLLEFTHDMGRAADGSQEMFDVVGFRNQPINILSSQLLKTCT